MFLHTRLKVRDIERSIAFYTQHFGLTCRARKTSPRGTQLAFMHVKGSPTELELAFLPWDVDFKLDEDIFHIAFRVDDMAATVERMRQAGVKITEEPSDGGHMAFIEDPDGYEIELLEQHAEAFVFAERARFAPKGVLGGGDGACNSVSYQQAVGWEAPPLGSKVVGVQLARGQRIRIESPGGGGWGDPARRDPALAERDRRMGYAS